MQSKARSRQEGGCLAMADVDGGWSTLAVSRSSTLSEESKPFFSVGVGVVRSTQPKYPTQAPPGPSRPQSSSPVGPVGDWRASSVPAFRLIVYSGLTVAVEVAVTACYVLNTEQTGVEKTQLRCSISRTCSKIYQQKKKGSKTSSISRSYPGWKFQGSAKVEFWLWMNFTEGWARVEMVVGSGR